MTRRLRLSTLLRASLLLFVLLLSRLSVAGGLYYSDRGVRPLGRGGAFVAGADDLGSIAYNPAGLADAKSSVLLDLAWVNVASEYTRRTIVSDSAGNTSVVTSPTVQGTTPFLLVPTLAGSWSPSVWHNMFTFALGVHAPYSSLTSWPATVDGQPSPSRYSLVTLDGTVLAVPGAYVAVKPIEELRIGVGIDALVGTLQSSQVFSASPQDRLLSAPESPEYDASAKLKTGTIFAPSAHFGVIAVPHRMVRVGLAYHLPYRVDVPAELDVTLPRASTFDNARQEGNSVRVKTSLPSTIRVGVEVRPLKDDRLRVEAAYVRELWNVHHEISVTPEDLRFYGVTGFPSPFNVPPIALPRNFRPTNSFRLGSELSVLERPLGVDVRGGVAYETSAVPSDYLTPLTADLDRLTLALGASIRPTSSLRLDVLYAHVFGFEQDADPKTAAVPAVNPIRGNPTVPSPINGGTYANHANIIGVGGMLRF